MNDVWWRQETPIGEITVVVGSGGVKAIGWTNEHDRSIVGRADNEAVPSIATELESWFGGRSQRFECDVDLGRVAAPFAHAVLTTLRSEVGWGETVTYGELAGMAGKPNAARAVGSAMAHNPVPFIVPCHRVIAAGGKLGGYGGTNDGQAANLSIKRWLLTHEGVLLHAG